METSNLDDLKRAEVDRWDGAAPAWAKWFHFLERGAQPVSDRMVALAGLREGMRVLDVASGLGEPAVTAARAVGATGRVLATDLAPGMVEHARRRIAPLALPQITVQQMDAEAPGLPERSFDAVLCRFGLMFMPSLDRALVELRKLLVPGGRLCAAVWSTPERVPFLWIAQSTARRVLQLPATASGGPSPFALADVPALKSRMERAGFSRVQDEAVHVVMRFRDPAEFVDCVREMSTSTAKLVGGASPAQQRAVWAALEEAAASYTSPEGLILDNEAWCLAAEVAG